MDTKEQIREFVTRNRANAVELLKELGRIPSPSHHEDKRAAFCQDWFIHNGCQDVRIDSAKNVVCRFEAEPDKPYTILTAHTDVVFEDTRELPMKQDGNLLYAPGIGDDTANLVNLMMCARFLAAHRDQQKHNILIVANSCEEGLGNLDGAKQIFTDWGSQAAAFCSFDGTLGSLTDVPVGSHRYKVTIRTQGGHSYGDSGRDNAIELAARMIERLYAVKVPETHRTTYNVGVIHGGSTVNSIAQEVEFLYEYRSDSDDCLKQMKKAFMAIVDDFTAAGKQVEVKLLGVRPGMGDIDRQALKKFTEQNVALIKEFYEGDVICEPGSTDANVPLSMGILGNTVGTIVGEGAHTRQEWVNLDSVPVGMSVALNILLHYMQ